MYRHVPAVYARHVCPEPEHLTIPYPDGLLDAPLSIGQRCVLTVGIHDIARVARCAHITKPVSTVEVHYLRNCEVYHCTTAVLCIDILGIRDLTQAEGVRYLNGGNIPSEFPV